jgi:hypothetical protein
MACSMNLSRVQGSEGWIGEVTGISGATDGDAGILGEISGFPEISG